MQTEGMLPHQLFAYQYPVTDHLLEFIRMSDYVEAAAGSFIAHNYIQKLAQEEIFSKDHIAFSTQEKDN